MNCPFCDEPAARHNDESVFDFETPSGETDYCDLTETQATLAAQRHAAAVGLWAMRRDASAALTTEDSAVIWQSIYACQRLLRALGIQRPRRSERHE